VHVYFNIQLMFCLCIYVLISKVAKKVFIGNLKPNETVDASNEASLLRHLDHPAIVKFYDSFVEADFFYIITEYCEVLKTVGTLFYCLVLIQPLRATGAVELS